MEKLENQIRDLSKKIDEINTETKLEKIVKFAEKVILPSAVILLSVLSYNLTKKVQEAQIAQNDVAINSRRLENERAEKVSKIEIEMKYVDMVYTDITSSDSIKITNAINFLMLFGFEHIEKLTAYFTQLNLPDNKREEIRTIYRVKREEREKEVQDKSESLEKKFNESKNSKFDITAKQIETEIEVLENENNTRLNSRIETYNQNRKVLNNLSSQDYNGDRELLKKEFWKLYWEDMIKYENKQIEYLMVQYGEQLKSNDKDFSSLTTISEKIKAEMDNQTQSSTWVKKGYYRLHDNFKIVLIDLEIKAETAVFEFKDSENKLLNKSKFNIGDTTTLKTDNIHYTFKFDGIDKAGKNPLTKAAFYTIKDR